MIIRSLQQTIEWRGKLLAQRCDSGPEFISYDLIDWAIKEQITLLYIQPGKPTPNAYIERFNRTARFELLELHLFEDIEHAQLLATQCQCIYNDNRYIQAHSAIAGVPPRQLP
jgi:putative transposase